MYRKVVRSVSVLLLLLLASCSVEMPKDVPSLEKMEAVLYDYHLVQSMEGVAYSTGEYKEKLLYRYVFEKHGMTKADFDSALVWYNRNPKYMVEIYRKIESRLQKEIDAFALIKSVQEEGVDLNSAYLGSNISELWTGHGVKMLSSVPLNNKLSFSFSTPDDSTFVAGDSLAFSFNAMFISHEENATRQHAVASINFEYSDNTAGSKDLFIDETGHYELNVPRYYASRLKSMGGYVYYFDNDTTLGSRVIISDISLRRLHPVQVRK